MLVCGHGHHVRNDKNTLFTEVRRKKFGEGGMKYRVLQRCCLSEVAIQETVALLLQSTQWDGSTASRCRLAFVMGREGREQFAFLAVAKW